MRKSLVVWNLVSEESIKFDELSSSNGLGIFAPNIDKQKQNMTGEHHIVK